MQREYDRAGARLARAYLRERASQLAETQPARDQAEVRRTAQLPRLDAIQLNSPEASSQFRLAHYARLSSSGEDWFLLAPQPPRR
jgi:hypothetical protein